MATLTKGQTFGASETITNTKLHNLVDLGSVSNIVNEDIDAAANIADTKLAQITTTNKVSGTAIGFLASIPSGAGIIPFSNVSLVTIPNASLLPLTLASWVDASSFKNIQSMPSLAGQLPWYSVVSSLASGAFPIFDGITKLIGIKVPAEYTAGNYKIIPDPMPFTSNSNTSYTKVSEIYLPRAGTLRVKFWLAVSGGHTVSGRIYRNGVAIGTEQTTTSIVGTQFSEDIAGWSIGDLLQLYAKISSGVGEITVGGLELFEGTPNSEKMDDSTYRQAKHYTITNAATIVITSMTGLGSIGDTAYILSGGAATTLYVKTAAGTWTAK